MLFGPIEEIVQVNQEMLKRLEERLETSKSMGKGYEEMVIGDIFSAMVGSFPPFV